MFAKLPKKQSVLLLEIILLCQLDTFIKPSYGTVIIGFNICRVESETTIDGTKGGVIIQFGC